MADRISSDESEGFFEEFIEERLEELIDGIINDGELERAPGDSGELVIEMNDITPPTFSYGDNAGGSGAGPGPGGPGDEPGRLRFGVPFERFMELARDKLGLPDLTKEGSGSIKQISYRFKTLGSTGVILDRRRTFKRAFKSSIGMQIYDPANGRYRVEIQRRDRRYKIPQREEIPKYKAVVFYIGDISYSTYGERLSLEKRLLNFVHHWLDFNYGKNNVEHRYIVHDAKAYEVSADDFYKVSNIGGTRAALAFDLIARIAGNEYDSATTNLYAFYVGDGELFDDDAGEIVELLHESLLPAFNRICLVEVKPSQSSILNQTINSKFGDHRLLRTLKIEQGSDLPQSIRKMFGARRV